MTRYIVKGFTACNQHLFTEVVEAPTKTIAGMHLFAKLKRSPDDAVMVALTTHVDVREVV
jgi:hypothetical protein